MPFSESVLERMVNNLTVANADVLRRYPGDSGRRQPAHVVYGGAHLFKADTARKLGGLALEAFTRHAPDAETLARVTGMPAEFAPAVRQRVIDKLLREPVEDYRIDFEDGFGYRSDAEEDEQARRTAEEVIKGALNGTLPPFIGIRVKPLSRESYRRSLRTLEIFMEALSPSVAGFVVTLPKIEHPMQVAVLADALETLEGAPAADSPRTGIELMIENPAAIRDLGQLIDSGRGRVRAAHFGAYDYTAALGIVSTHQHLLHPACEQARAELLAAGARTGLHLSDGATNVLPIGDAEAVHAAWALHYRHIRHALECGYYQGWDLHPAQIPMRFAALQAFFLESLEANGQRLRNFIGHAARATRVRDVFDDAATGQGLLNFFTRALNAGAVSEDEAASHAGVTARVLRMGSFPAIIDAGRLGDEKL